MDHTQPNSQPKPTAHKLDRLRKPQMWAPLVAAALALKIIQFGVLSDHQTESKPSPAPQNQETVPATQDNEVDHWIENYQRAQAEIKNRLLTDSPVSYFLGTVELTRKNSGEHFRTITNPILMTDSDVFEPGTSHKKGARPEDNFDFAPWAIVGNHGDYDFELSIDFMDSPDYEYKFFDVEGREIEVAGMLLPQNTNDFVSHTVFTSDLTVVKASAGSGYIIQAPDGTQISRDESQ